MSFEDASKHKRLANLAESEAAIQRQPSGMTSQWGRTIATQPCISVIGGCLASRHSCRSPDFCSVGRLSLVLVIYMAAWAQKWGFKIDNCEFYAVES